MRKLAHIFIIAVASLVWSLDSSSAQTFSIATNNIIFNFSTLGLNPALINSVTMQSVGNISTPKAFFAQSRQSWSIAGYPAMTNGYVIASNMIYGLGVTYQIQLSDGYTLTTTNFCIPSTAGLDANGNTPANQWIGAGLSPNFSWSSPFTTNITVGGTNSGVNVTHGLLTTSATNSGTVTIDVNTNVVPVNTLGEPLWQPAGNIFYDGASVYYPNGTTWLDSLGNLHYANGQEMASQSGSLYGNGAPLTNLNAAALVGTLPANTLPGNVVTNDPTYLAFVASNNITAQAVLNDLQGVVKTLNSGGHRADFQDMLILDPRFGATNLSLSSRSYYTTGAVWSAFGFRFQGTNFLSNNNVSDDATNGVSFTLPSPLTTNTVVITWRWADVNGHDSYSAPWENYFGSIFGLNNTNDGSGIWAGLTVASGNNWQGARFLEKSNSTAMSWDSYGAVTTASNVFSMASMQTNVYVPGVFSDTKTFLFTSDGHGKREVWIDGIKSTFANGTMANYQSTNYPSSSMQMLCLGSTDTNWLKMVATPGFNNRALNYEVSSVQIYSCYADAALVKSSFQMAQYIPAGNRADFWHGDSLIDTGTATGWTGFETWSNKLPYVMMQTINPNGNNHVYARGGSRLDLSQTNLFLPWSWMPRDKYTDLRMWTDEGHNDTGEYGTQVNAAVIFSNQAAFYGPYKARTGESLNYFAGYLTAPNAGGSVATNKITLNNLESSWRLVDKFLPAWLLIQTNTMTNLLWSTDGSHLSGTNGWMLTQMLSDDWNGKPYTEPVSGTYYANGLVSGGTLMVSNITASGTITGNGSGLTNLAQIETMTISGGTVAFSKNADGSSNASLTISAGTGNGNALTNNSTTQIWSGQQNLTNANNIIAAGSATFSSMTVTMPITNGPALSGSNSLTTTGWNLNTNGNGNFSGTVSAGGVAIGVPSGGASGYVFTLTNTSTGQGTWSNAPSATGSGNAVTNTANTQIWQGPQQLTNAANIVAGYSHVVGTGIGQWQITTNQYMSLIISNQFGIAWNLATNGAIYDTNNNVSIPMTVSGSYDGDLESALQNTAQTTNASTSMYVVADNGLAGINGYNYGQIGINGSKYHQLSQYFGVTNDFYIFSVGQANGYPSTNGGGNTVIGVLNTNGMLEISVGNGGTVTNAYFSTAGETLMIGSYVGTMGSSNLVGAIADSLLPGARYTNSFDVTNAAFNALKTATNSFQGTNANLSGWAALTPASYMTGAAATNAFQPTNANLSALALNNGGGLTNVQPSSIVSGTIGVPITMSSVTMTGPVTMWNSWFWYTNLTGDIIWSNYLAGTVLTLKTNGLILGNHPVTDLVTNLMNPGPTEGQFLAVHNGSVVASNAPSGGAQITNALPVLNATNLVTGYLVLDNRMNAFNSHSAYIQLFDANGNPQWYIQGSDQYWGRINFQNNGLNQFSIGQSGISTVSTNVIISGVLGCTNSTANNYTISITAGTGMAMKDPNNTVIFTPIINGTYPFKPSWGLSGTGVTAIAVVQ